jgi:asparagine N-glycosylation enzyme membrane subunit Stt3
MPGPLDQISIVVVGYAALVLLVSAYSAYRWGERPPWLDSMAWMLEVLLVIRALAGLGALAGGDSPASATTHVGYLISSVCVIPIALRSVAEDRGPWSIGVVAVAVLAVGVISVRMMMTL